MTFVADDGDDLELTVTAGPAGYLVLADTWLPGWSAEIDGVPNPVVRGNLWMRTVRLPAVACTVRFHYSPPGLLPGLLSSLAALLAMIAGGVIAISRRCQPRADNMV